MADNKVAKVYDAVLELVNRQSNPLKITVSEIADKCGIGKGTVYEYFKSKDDIFIKTFKHFTELVIKDIESIEGNTFEELFYGYYDQLVKMQKKCNAAFLTIMFGDSRFMVTEDMAIRVNSILEPLKECMKVYTTKMLIRGIEEGILSSDIDEFSVYYASMGVVSTLFTANSPIGENIFKDIKPTVEACYKCYIKLLKN